MPELPSARRDPSDDPLDPGALDVLVRPAPPRSWRERAVDLADATGTTPARIAAGAVVVAVAVVVGLWLTRPASPPPEVSLPFASTGSSATSPSTTGSTSTTEPTEVVVDVAGRVQRPGVLHLAAGSRVVDAIEAAGGLAADADGARLNLAAPLADGQRVYVPAVGEAEPPIVGPSGGSSGGAADGGGTGSVVSGAPTAAHPLDLNTASAAELDALPGVGPATAEAIIQHRDEVGGFTSVDQLLDVPGIGPAKLERIRPLVRV